MVEHMVQFLSTLHFHFIPNLERPINCEVGGILPTHDLWMTFKGPQHFMVTALRRCPKRPLLRTMYTSLKKYLLSVQYVKYRFKYFAQQSTEADHFAVKCAEAKTVGPAATLELKAFRIRRF